MARPPSIRHEISVFIICHPDLDKQNYFPKGIIEDVTYFDNIVDRAVKNFLNNENNLSTSALVTGSIHPI